MATFTTNARLKKPVQGDEVGTWGTTTNTLADQIDAMSGYVAHSNGDANETITIGDGTASDARYFFLDITGALTATRTITLAPNTVKKIWILRNSTTGGQLITLKQGSGNSIDLVAGETVFAYGDGAGATAALVDILEVRFGASSVMSIGNNTSIRARNNADSGFISIVKLNTSDLIEFGTQLASINVSGDSEMNGALNHDGSTAGFYGTAPVSQQTGVAVSAAGIHAALVNLGLITA